MKKHESILWHISVCLLLLLVIIAAGASYIAPFEPEAIDLYQISSAPSAEHWLGTDELGRDVLSRLLYGGRVSLFVGMFAAAIQVLLGTVIGAVSGYYGGKVDYMLSKVTELVLCFPFFVIAITMAALLGPGIKNIVLILGLLSWPGLARIVRAEVIGIKKASYVEAAIALGLSETQIIRKHILPGIGSSVLIYATTAVANCMLSEASLSFLGMGIRPPMASWGNMLSAAQNLSVIAFEWWNWVPASIMILVTVLCIYYIGDCLSRKHVKTSVL